MHVYRPIPSFTPAISTSGTISRISLAAAWSPLNMITGVPKYGAVPGLGRGRRERPFPSPFKPGIPERSRGEHGEKDRGQLLFWEAAVMAADRGAVRARMARTPNYWPWKGTPWMPISNAPRHFRSRLATIRPLPGGDCPWRVHVHIPQPEDQKFPGAVTHLRIGQDLQGFRRSQLPNNSPWLWYDLDRPRQFQPETSTQITNWSPSNTHVFSIPRYRSVPS